jgi:Galactose oxidase, central domain
MFSRSQATKTLIVLAAAAAFWAASQPVLGHASTWKKLAPATAPKARAYPAMAYDPVSKKVVLFGGYDSSGVDLNDTWTFDGTTWTKMKTAVAPSARRFVTMAFDKRSNKLVMFGGFNPNTQQILRDTWVWDGATSTWTQVKMKTSPPAGYGSMLFNDPHSGTAMMFGGFNITHIVPAYSTTWRSTGTGWQKLHPKTIPIPRGWGVTWLDSKRNNVIMTGGNGDTIRTDNTWIWDGSNWTQQFPATQIQATVGSGYAFDPEVQAVVVFGGFGQQTGDTNETWEWTGSNWVILNPTKLPSAREGVGMAYDPASRQTLMFGGQLANGNVLKDSWALTGH